MISPECIHELCMIYPVRKPEDVYKIQKLELPEYLAAMNLLDAQHVLGLETPPEKEDDILTAFRERHTDLLQQEQKFYAISVQAGIYALKDEVPGAAHTDLMQGQQPNEGQPRPSYMENPLEIFFFARAQMEYVRLVEWAKISAAKVLWLEELKKRLRIHCPENTVLKHFEKKASPSEKSLPSDAT